MSLLLTTLTRNMLCEAPLLPVCTRHGSCMQAHVGSSGKLHTGTHAGGATMHVLGLALRCWQAQARAVCALLVYHALHVAVAFMLARLTCCMCSEALRA